MTESDQIEELRIIQEKMNPEAFTMLVNLAHEWLKEYPRKDIPKLRLISRSQR